MGSILGGNPTHRAGRGDAQLRELFPGADWEVLESGPMTMRGVPLTSKGDFEPIPSFCALVRPRAAPR